MIGFSAGMAAGCDRLVDPGVAGCERARQRRFLSLLLAGPFVLAAVWPAAFAGGLPADASLAAIATVFFVAWALAALVARGGRSGPALRVALGVGAAALAVALAGAGGLGSPALLLVVSLVFEPWWVLRSRSALLWGTAAAALVVAAQAVPLAAAATAMGFAAWHWILPAAYLAMAAPRLASAVREELDAMRAPRESALEDVIDAVVLRIAPGGETLDATGRARDLIGVAPEMLLGEGFLDRVHVADRVALLRAGAAREGEATTFELRLRVASDRPGAFASFAAELHPGRPAILILRRNALVEALREEIAEAREHAASSDIAKARFLAAVSHELRTPLNAIIGFSDMLAFEMVGKFSDPRQKEYATLIRDSGSHLLGVVNSILDVSKIESGAYPIRPEPFRFADAAAMCHSMLGAQAAAKAVELANRVTPAAGDICADRRAVQQILINLLSNAVKFTPNGGSVTLDAARRGRMLSIRVADTGIGIAADDLTRIGRPFVQVQNDYTRQFDGTGLGLSIAKGLVSLHGGTMTIQSTPGAGTVVTVNLPLEGNGIAFPQEESPQAEIEEDGDAAFRKSA